MRTVASLALIALFSVVISLGQSPMFIQDVSWSADGRYLVFTGMHDIDRQKNTLKSDIFVIQTDGTGLKRITSDATNEFYTSWSKARVYFSSEKPGTKDSDIFSAKPDGTDVKKLTNGPGKNATPAATRNGKLVAFVSTRDTEKYQIYVMDRDGSGLRRLTTDNSVGYFNPQFSPDGKRIVYYAEKGDGLDQIWVMNADGSDQKLLTNNIGHNIFPSWSQDGKHIVFSSSKRDKNSEGSYVDGSYLYIMNSDGTGLKKIGDIKSFFARPSPDGKRIAYISGRFPTTNIFIANIDGSSPVQITKQ